MSIRLRALSIGYGEASPVLEIASLDLAAGSYTLVTGPTGCGKSSLALALAGVLEEMTDARVSGEISFDVRGEFRPVAAVWQRPEAQLFRGTILDEVRSGLDFQLVDAAEGTRRARDAVRLVGLEHLDELRDPVTLSGGEQQRLALAAALVLETPILVLDEVASQLDRAANDRLSEIIASVRATRELTVVAFDHRPDPHLPHADRVIVLGGDGRIALDGTAAEAYGAGAARCREIGIRLPSTRSDAERGRPPRDRGETPALRIAGLTVRRRAADLLHEVSLALPLGAVALLAGANGSGKTTLLNALSGAQRGLRGRIEPAKRRRRRAGIGYAPQRGSELMLTRTVRDELRITLLHRPDRDVARGVARQDTDLLLDRAGLLHLADAHPQRLSGGQRQRLSVLLAAASNPALLLLDEPTNAQDAAGAARIRAVIEHDSTRRVALIATHEEKILAGLATHRIELHGGEVQEVVEL